MTSLEQIMQNLRGEVRYNAALGHLTWFKVGGPAEVLFKPSDTLDLAQFCNQNDGKLDVTVIGVGSNLIIRDGGVDGVVIKLGRGFTDIELLTDGTIAVGAACLNFNLATFCKEHSLSGLEFLVGIPGTAGGGINMNAGAYGYEFKDVITKIEGVTKDGRILELLAEEIGFSYRASNLPEGLIVTKVFFKPTPGDRAAIVKRMAEINEMRSNSQPITEKTGGSTFANPVGYKAWQLIDKAGMRGYRVGDAEMSKLHCNFMINLGKAKAADLENLGELVRKKVLKTSGVDLQWEIKLIGKPE